MSRAARHVAALGKLVSGPADALLLVRMVGWWLALPVLKRVVPLERLVRLAQLEPARNARDPGQESRVVSLAAWLFKNRPRHARDNCLERSLVAYRFLGRLNARPELVVGVGSEDEKVLGHVWVTVDGRAVLDPPASLETYASLVVFGSDGQAIRTAPASPGSG
jgi:hypothetical protein